jgi:hypothetical protein
VFDTDLLAPGETVSVTFSVSNPGERVLRVKSIGIAPASASDAFVLGLPSDWGSVMASSGAYLVSPVGGSDAGIPDRLDFTVTYVRKQDGESPEGQLVLESDASNKPVVTVGLSTREGSAKIQLSKEHLDFGVVPTGITQSLNVTVLNTGGTDLAIDRLTITGDAPYVVSLHGTDFSAGDQGHADVTLPEPVVVGPQSTTYLTVRFTPEDGSPAQAQLTLFSNDPSAPDGTGLLVVGNMTVPCISTNPDMVSFGNRMVGSVTPVPLEIVNCGEMPLNLTGLALSGDPARFGVDTSTLPHEPTEENPVMVPINGLVTLNVIYTATELSPLGVDGAPIADAAVLSIHNDSLTPVRQVDLVGVTVNDLCPSAVIKSAEGDEVIPQTLLHLYGDQSYAPDGAIAKWSWSVQQPVGSQSVFVPSATFPNPTFEVNVAGVYVFTLTVFDQYGKPACFPASYEVLVISDEAIHVELLWSTPGDPDETDTGPEAGSDVDLHFLHPYAAGPDLDGDGKPDGWFDVPFDTFWFNAHPNWGSFDPVIDDNPGLDRDDTDGAGPENLNLDVPENGATYRVGVHYWNDHGYGSAYATVRVYVYGTLVFEVKDVLLVHKDMWDVCTIDWPSGQVTLVTDPNSEGYRIIPDYVNPFFGDF